MESPNRAPHDLGGGGRGGGGGGPPGGRPPPPPRPPPRGGGAPPADPPYMLLGPAALAGGSQQCLAAGEQAPRLAPRPARLHRPSPAPNRLHTSGCRTRGAGMLKTASKGAPDCPPPSLSHASRHRSCTTPSLQERRLPLPVVSIRGLSQADRGTELTSGAVLSWAGEAGIDRRYVAPGKPQQSGCAESGPPPDAGRAAERDSAHEPGPRPWGGRCLHGRLQRRAAHPVKDRDQVGRHIGGGVRRSRTDARHGPLPENARVRSQAIGLKNEQSRLPAQAAKVKQRRT